MDFKKIWPFLSLGLNIILIIILLVPNSTVNISGNAYNKNVKSETMTEEELEFEINSELDKFTDITSKYEIDANCLYEPTLSSDCMGDLLVKFKETDFSKEDKATLTEISNNMDEIVYENHHWFKNKSWWKYAGVGIIGFLIGSAK
jgi:hypothetical protein